MGIDDIVANLKAANECSDLANFESAQTFYSAVVAQINAFVSRPPDLTKHP